MLCACESLDEWRDKWLKEESVGPDKKHKGCQIQGFFLGFIVKTEKCYVRNWFLIFILFQCNNVADFKWSYSQFLAAVWRAELDPPVALENFLPFKCTSKNYGFLCGCYKCVQPWNTSSCSTNLQQFSNVTCSKLGFFQQEQSRKAEMHGPSRTLNNVLPSE